MHGGRAYSSLQAQGIRQELGGISALVDVNRQQPTRAEESDSQSEKKCRLYLKYTSARKERRKEERQRKEERKEVREREEGREE